MKKRSIKQSEGQFIIIAVLLIATMIISLGTLLFTSSTYYKYEPWQEYMTLISNIQLNSNRLVELSLANYTFNTDNVNVLKNNLRNWTTDLFKIYPGYGINLDYSIEGNGVAHNWSSYSSFSSANIKFTLDINNLGLSGYEFSSIIFMNLTISEVNVSEKSIKVEVTKNGQPIINLKKDNFAVEGLDIVDISSNFEENKQSYTLFLNPIEDISQPVLVYFWENSGIKVEAIL